MLGNMSISLASDPDLELYLIWSVTMVTILNGDIITNQQILCARE